MSKKPDPRSYTRGLDIADELIDGRHGPIPVRRYAPGIGAGQDKDPLIWLHGGAFSWGGLDQLESHAVACALANEGWPVVAVDYRLAPPWSWIRKPKPGILPGIRFPVPLEDVVDVIHAIRNEVPRRRLVLGGASAGACLAAAATLHLRDEEMEGPDRLVLAYGTFHAALPALTPEIKARVRGRHGIAQFNRATVERMNRNYAGSPAAMSDFHAFPGGANLAGFPPTLMLDADHDTLRASGQAFSDELKDAGTAIEYRLVADSRHGFLDKPETPAFAEGIRRMQVWLNCSRRDEAGNGASSAEA
ncbi:xylan 1,4-beta-xylosidase [Paenarthrobacter nicotinovorans]|uniref:alpha/beta hydrolase n=1 Tax=Micrococcaceae TaxID=1268 RepID=UPI0008765378|nr:MULTISPECIES: alpha/beta hydrolase [Micrococcaceae]MDR6438693.1 xylan 1,4-beta-xylosidase [Paenarthrobacter nicotinovorans]SCZ56537.1 Acetyl esterase/lipase [Arthrobacter sp. UNCCL28]